MSDSCANIFCANVSVEECKPFMAELADVPTRDIMKEFLTMRGKMGNATPLSPKFTSILEPLLKSVSGAKIKMVKTNKSLLFTNENWVWGEAFEKAIEISRELSISCFSIDYKEYGPFMVSLIENGEVVSKFSLVEESNDYGFKKSSIDFNAFVRITGCDLAELGDAFAEEDKETIIDGLSELVGIDCLITFDELHEEVFALQSPIKSNKRCELYVIG